eukprot:Pgem_evm2s19760
MLYHNSMVKDYGNIQQAQIQNSVNTLENLNNNFCLQCEAVCDHIRIENTENVYTIAEDGTKKLTEYNKKKLDIKTIYVKKHERQIIEYDKRKMSDILAVGAKYAFGKEILSNKSTLRRLEEKNVRYSPLQQLYVGTPLEKYINVLNTPFDVMHLLFTGIVKKLFWVTFGDLLSGQNKVKEKEKLEKYINLISDNLPKNRARVSNI